MDMPMWKVRRQLKLLMLAISSGVKPRDNGTLASALHEVMTHGNLPSPVLQMLDEVRHALNRQARTRNWITAEEGERLSYILRDARLELRLIAS